MAGHRKFCCQILVLSKIWGQHTEAPWNSACAHMFSLFPSINIWNRIRDFKVGSSTCAWGSRLKLNICMFGVAQACAAPKTMEHHFIGQVKTTMGDYRRWYAPKSPEHAHATTWNVHGCPLLKITSQNYSLLEVLIYSLLIIISATQSTERSISSGGAVPLEK